MSNKDLKDRKLQPYQRIIWRKAFEASMQHTSIEAAEKKAWQAVDIWERVGAFHESQQPSPVPENKPTLQEYEDAWLALMTRIGECAENEHDWENRLAKSMNAFAANNITTEDFKEDVEQIFPETDD